MISGLFKRLFKRLFKHRELSKRQRVEKWFLGNGLPHFIRGYGGHSDILVRAVPVLALVYLAESILATGNRWTGWAQFGISCLFIAVLLGAGVILNLFQGRPAFSLPSRLGKWEQGIFIFVPALLSMLSATDGVFYTFLFIASLNFIILVAVFLWKSYGIGPMLWWSLKFMFTHFRELINQVAKSVPLLLLFATFIFLTAEIWQVASDMSIGIYFLIIGFLLFLGLGFLTSRVVNIPEKIRRFNSQEEALGLASQAGSPLGENLNADISEALMGEKLKRRIRINMGLLLFMGYAVRFFFVGIVIGGFYLIFGLLSVREDTIEQWTTQIEAEALTIWNFLGVELFLTSEHFIVAGFIAAFATLQFAVTSGVQDTYEVRDEEEQAGQQMAYGAQFVQEMREVLAVRLVYLSEINKGNLSP